LQTIDRRSEEQIMAVTTSDPVASRRVIDGPIISADSHITEPGSTYVDHVDPAYRDRAPSLTDEAPDGATFHVPGMPHKIHLGLHSAAGRDADQLSMLGVPFDELHRAGWDPEARVEAQRADGVDGEVIYPSVGMLLCNHPDLDLKKALFDGYNRWIAEYCATDPDRLYGCGQTALRTVTEGIADLEAIKAAGLRGVMLPGTPGPAYETGGPDYDDPAWDDLYTAATDLGLVLSFHILTGPSYRARGPKLNNFMSIIRGNQDLIGTLVFGGVFDRQPDLRLVCVEADAGWAPHYGYRMDHAYDRHRNWLRGAATLQRQPSEYFADHVKLTFQDDWSAFRMAEAGLIPARQLMWANDYPHSDSTWPYSQQMLAEQTAAIDEEDLASILGGNAVELYGLADLFPPPPPA
jgi:predicted TIM-barrel fold metal-dependent hydrolase